MTIILGIDPGSIATGYGLIETDGQRYRCLDYGVIRVAKTSLGQQLYEIYNDLHKVLAIKLPNEVAIEEVFVKINVNSALKLGQARGAIITAIASHNLPIYEYSTRQVKKSITGYGGAEKNQMQHMVKVLLNLTTIPPQDAADALAIALCHAHMRSGFLSKITTQLK